MICTELTAAGIVRSFNEDAMRLRDGILNSVKAALSVKVCVQERSATRCDSFHICFCRDRSMKECEARGKTPCLAQNSADGLSMTDRRSSSLGDISDAHIQAEALDGRTLKIEEGG